MAHVITCDVCGEPINKRSEHTRIKKRSWSPYHSESRSVEMDLHKLCWAQVCELVKNPRKNGLNT